MKFVKRLVNLPILFLGVGIVCGLVALIIYYATGINEFNDTLSPLCLGFSYAAIILGVVLVLARFFGVDNLKHIGDNFDILVVTDYLFGLAAFLFFITSKVNYIANVFVSIDGTTFDPAFIMTILFYLISFVAILVSSILYKKIVQENKEWGN